MNKDELVKELNDAIDREIKEEAEAKKDDE